MIDTAAEPVTLTADAHHVRCEAMLQCVDKCCDPVPCTRAAAARVTFQCGTPGCNHASHVLLLCAVHAEAAATEPGATRRPLLPVAAAVILGIKGISAQMKSTTSTGTELAANVKVLKGEIATLETTASGGLAAGLSKAIGGRLS